jgi:glycerol kinase
MRHILAIDQGTTNTKVFLFDERAAVVAQASRPVPIAFPRAGWVEQDADVIWCSVRDAIGECLSGAPGSAVAAVALTNQRESVVLWDRASGRPAGPVISWQCRRTTAFCETLRERGLQARIESTTGLTLDPLFSASKLRWLLDSVPDGSARAEQGEVCAGTIDSWLIWNLTGGAVHACDATNASRTQLLDLRSAGWDAELLSVFSIPAPVLPAVRPSSGIFGEVTTIRGLEGVPIASAIGDSHAALFGHAAFVPGEVKATYGTGSSLMSAVSGPVRSRHRLSTTIAWSIDGRVQHALEGNITVTGSAVAWIGQIAGLASAADAGDLARSVDDTGGVYFVPALAGLGAPYWDADARGLVCGLSRGTTTAHIARAGVESIGYQIRDVFEAMGEDAGAPSALLADGGAAANDALMQFQADILGVPVIRSGALDVSALGTAWLAGLAIGVWRGLDELSQLPRSAARFEPVMRADRREQLYSGWLDAVGRTLTARGQQAPQRKPGRGGRGATPTGRG